MPKQTERFVVYKVKISVFTLSEITTHKTDKIFLSLMLKSSALKTNFKWGFDRKCKKIPVIQGSMGQT